MKYSKEHPFLGSVRERYRLNYRKAGESTHHVVLDISGSGIEYEVGDCIGIFPRNDADLVEKTIKAMHAHKHEVVVDGKTGESYSLWEYLSTKKDLRKVTKTFLETVAASHSGCTRDEALARMARGYNHLSDYIAAHHVWDFLLENPDVHLAAQEICDFLLPLQPRLYSIASSMGAVGEAIELTIRLLNYETNGWTRRGVCSSYLIEDVMLDEAVVPLYLNSHRNLCLPEDPSRDIIMIGPGTGVAPFRAFMQERVGQGATGENWLFFGEWTRENDFFYQDYWEGLVADGNLRLDVAFSRDQDYKIYVQDRMWERREEVWEWMNDRGAILYVCGDAEHMAKDVDQKIIEIAETVGGLQHDEAKQYLRNLRSEGRYMRDVY